MFCRHTESEFCNQHKFDISNKDGGSIFNEAHGAHHEEAHHELYSRKDDPRVRILEKCGNYRMRKYHSVFF